MRPLLLILFALLLAACADPETDRRLARAEALMMTAPDSAAAVLDSIDPSPLRGRRAALHALLRTHANYRNYITDTDDSLINIAVDYFTSHPDPARLMVARYCQGRILDNARRYSEAMTAALTALDLATDLNDPFYQARAHELMGDLWYRGSAFIKSSDDYLKASVLFSKANRIENAKWSVQAAAVGYIAGGETDRGVRLLDSLKNANPQDSAIVNESCRHLFRVVISRNLRRAAQLLDTLGLYNYADQHFIYCSRAQLLARSGYPELAVEMLDSAKILNTSLDAENNRESAEVFILWAEGKYDDVIRRQNQHIAYLDSLYTAPTRDEIYQASSAYFEERTATANKSLRHSKLLILVLTFTLIAFIYGGYLFYRHQIKRKNRIMSETMSQILELSASYQAACSSIAEKEGAIGLLSHDLEELSNRNIAQVRQSINLDGIDAKIIIIRELSELFFTYDNNQSKMKEKVFQTVSGILDELRNKRKIEALYASIDSSSGGLLSQFKSSFPKVSQKDMGVLILCAAGLNIKTISLILNTKPTTIYSARTRLRNMVAASSFVRKKEIESLL